MSHVTQDGFKLYAEAGPKILMFLPLPLRGSDCSPLTPLKFSIGVECIMTKVLAETQVTYEQYSCMDHSQNGAEEMQ
ncbi:hypothetical protein H671_2g5883 [Cricetulus griseus]|nr:hypothetical protein H671_2g5883 [Cricetulus griseus]